MPARSRRHALALLCSALLGLGAAPLAFAQTSSVPDVSQVPQLGPGTTTTQPAPARATTTARTTARRPARTVATSASRPAATTPVAATAGKLPATGMDGRILAGLGAGLLLCGIGLRMRTARERF